jgi:type IV pilus assembly protein PilQ
MVVAMRSGLLRVPGPLAALLLAAALAAAGTGEKEVRISLDVKDAAITDVVRLLAEVADFQVVFQPGVSCSLTLKLNEVRWQSALDLSLRACRLARDEENGIIRIATAAQFLEEIAAQRQLDEARRAVAPQRLATFRLSYARVQQIAPLLKSQLSPRAVITFDERTNTLIIVD